MTIAEKERIVRKNVIEIFKENFNISQTDDEILFIKPEIEFKTNCTDYYESILEIFFLESKHLDSITGNVKETIKKVTELWTITPRSSFPWIMQ